MGPPNAVVAVPWRPMARMREWRMSRRRRCCVQAFNVQRESEMKNESNEGR